MYQGFVKLPRDIINWRWFSDANILKLYIYLLTTAVFKTTQWKNETLESGQVVIGRRMLAAQLKMTENQVRAALEKLKSSKDISIKTTNKYSVITLLNWGKIEGDDYFFTNKSPTNRQQNTNKPPQKKNVYNVKNVKNNSAQARKNENAHIIDSIDWSQMDLIINGDQ